MVGTKIKITLGIGFLAVALLSITLGRMTASPAGEGGDKKPTAAVALLKLAEAKAPAGGAAESPPEPVAPAGPGNDLVVRRPSGTFSREIPLHDKFTVRFTENRMHIVANISIDGANFTFEADADYSINRESMVYGIVTSVDVTVPRGLDAEEAGEIAMIARALNDTPFAFRVRVDDDSVTIKDIRFGALGSPSFGMLFELIGDGEELMLVTALLGGKYKADSHPEKDVPVAPRANPPVPKKPQNRS